jgi:hypothetical protein
MSNVIARDFSILRDFRSIDWGATIKHNLLRAFCAGIVWAVVGFIAGGNQPKIPGRPAEFDTGFLLGMPLLFPVMYLIILLPMGVICGKLASVIPFVGWITFLFAILIVVGDPLVCIFSLFAPGLVPMHKPGFLMFTLIVYLIKADDDVEFAINDQRRSR